MSDRIEMIRTLREHTEYCLYSDLMDFNDFPELFNLLASATEADKITISLNSGGGRCDIGQMIIRAIQGCKAHVHVDVVYPSASMASLIALSGNSLTLQPGSYLMWHNYSGGAQGKGDAMVQGITADDRALKVMNAVCAPFLTPAEMRSVESDKDIYLFWDDKSLPDRIKRHFRTQLPKKAPKVALKEA